jgi:hypothetical protein
MKIVINESYGSLHLSIKATRRLAELMGRECYFYEQKDGIFVLATEILNYNDDYHHYFCFDIPNIQNVIDNAKMVGQNEEYNVYKKHEIYFSGDGDFTAISRTNPLLVQVVEELGRECDVRCVVLKVVEIPDGVDWYIDEGSCASGECVRELHRVWS